MGTFESIRYRILTTIFMTSFTVLNFEPMTADQVSAPAIAGQKVTAMFEADSGETSTETFFIADDQSVDELCQIRADRWNETHPITE